jgi:hypothetical protein
MNTSSNSPVSSMVKRLKIAADIVRADLKLVGERASYPWPGSDKLWGGYSYEIPKEEQVRSAFWAQLHDREIMACELEWNHYQMTGRKIANSEIDLVGFPCIGTSRAPVLLLEFKRVWSLNGWLNKSREMKAGIAKDMARLRRVLASLKVCSEVPPLAGVVVVAFSDDKSRGARDSSWDVWPGSTSEELWDVGEPICVSSLNETRRREIYSRADLFIVSADASDDGK